MEKTEQKVLPDGHRRKRRGGRWRQRVRWPYLDFWFDCGVLRLQTHLMSFDMCDMTMRWVVLHVKICNRWGFRVKLYSPDRHFRDRGWN